MSDASGPSAPPAAEYAARLAQHRRDEAALTRRHDLFGRLRLGLAAATIGLAWLAFGRGAISPLWLVGSAIAFALLMARHSRVLDARDRARRAAAFVEDGIARLEHRWQGRGAGGEEYLPADHPYGEDLDIVGRGSLFDLLSTPRTAGGERTLAAWLLAPAPPSEVRERQAAVRDLARRYELREHAAVVGPEIRAAANTVALAAWAATPVRPPPAWAPWALGALSAAVVAGIGTWIAQGEPPPWFVPLLAVQGLVGLALRRHVRTAIRHAEDRVRELGVIAALIGRIETESFDAPRLRALQERLRASGRAASAEIHRLARLVELLASRKNQLFGPISVLVCWATQLAWAIDRWRVHAGAHVPDWLAALGEIEALSALGTFTAERPDAVFPLVVDGEGRLEARDLRHPLLPAAIAVGNDIALGAAAPHLFIVSGSNMSGKSTWLRTVGINVVLAQAGAPVTAASMTMAPLFPAGTLRVQDSLQSGRSRFFAEITKLRQIVDLAKGHRGPERVPLTLFLLDELLAGTNSHDRRRGAEGILRGLLNLGAVGLATTHDLALTALATTLGANAENVHLADRFEQGGLEFDYRLRPGVVVTSNAIPLMRSIGLDV